MGYGNGIYKSSLLYGQRIRKYAKIDFVGGIKWTIFWGVKVIDKSNIEDFSVLGVWALFGMRNDVIDDRWYCL